MGAKRVIAGFMHAAAKNSPYILTGVCLGGNLAGTIMAVKATPKAMQDIAQAEKAKGEKLTNAEIVKAAGKNYILAGSVILVSDILGILGIHQSGRRNAALTAAATMSQNLAREYQDKIIEKLGPEEEQKIRDEMNQEKVHKALLENPPKPDWVPQIGTGTQLFYYIRHGQWLRSDVETIRGRVNDFNQMLLGSWNGVSEEEFENELGLPNDGTSSQFGWNPNRALVEIYFVFPSDYNGYVSPWGEGAIGIDFRDGHEPTFGYDTGGDVYCG